MIGAAKWEIHQHIVEDTRVTGRAKIKGISRVRVDWVGLE